MRKNQGPVSRQDGQAMLIAVILFLGISATIVLGIAAPILKQVRMAQDLIKSKESYFLAEAGLEDAIWRIRSGKNVISGETISLDGSTTTLTVTTFPNNRVINSTADRGGLIRKMEAKVVTGIGVAFFYGAQSGTGGFILGNNAGIQGNVYSNGDIVGSPGAFITGSAYAANTAALVADQVNDSPTPISSCSSSTCIQFGDTAATEDFAQGIKVSTTSPINKVQLYLKRTSSTPGNLTVRIVTDNNGVPSTNTLDSVSLNASTVTTNFGWIEAVFPNSPELTASTTYWIVLDGTTSGTKYYTIGANTSYIEGQGKIGKYATSWSNTNPSGLDGYIRVYLGGLTSTISRIIVGSGTSGDASAHAVTNSTVHGSLYCQTGSGNNKACNTSQPVPSPQGFPISDANIVQWKEDAESGGTIAGDFNVEDEIASIGLRKITGDLYVINGGTLTLTGALWVQGDILLDNNAVIQLSSTYGINSGIIVVDGNVTISNNGNFEGSGQQGSYVMVVTTSDCPRGNGCNGANAIQVSNNAGTVILNAQQGTIHFSNNGGSNEAIGHTISLDNNALITYETGLANSNFTSGPSGGWDIARWVEVQ